MSFGVRLTCLVNFLAVRLRLVFWSQFCHLYNGDNAYLTFLSVGITFK